MTKKVAVKEIPATTLGRYRKEIQAVTDATKAELKKMGYQNSEQAIQATKKSIALRAKVTVAQLVAQIEALRKANPNVGKREADQKARDALILETQDVLSVVNLATAVNRKKVTISDEDKIKAFDSLGIFGNTLTDHLKTSFAPVGGMSMFWSPDCQVATAPEGLAVYIGGWNDGSKKPRFQYAPRKCPISKRSGYRDDSFTVKVFGIAPNQQ